MTGKRGIALVIMMLLVLMSTALICVCLDLDWDDILLIIGWFATGLLIVAVAGIGISLYKMAK